MAMRIDVAPMSITATGRVVDFVSRLESSELTVDMAMFYLSRMNIW